MAKINRFDGNVEAFAKDKLAGEKYLFGSSSTDSDELTDQYTSEFLRGWGTVGPSDFPPLEWFNALGFTMTQFVAYLHQMGIAEWNATQEYHTGSVCVYSGSMYKSDIDSNIGNQPDISNWTKFIDLSELEDYLNQNTTTTPLDNQWNGFFTIDHLTPLPNLGSIPATSGAGGTVYGADDEFTLNNFSSAASNTISLDDDGLIFSEGIYKLFTYTEEQLNLIDVAEVPVYIMGQDGSQHFVKHNGAGVVVTKPDTTTLKVQINNAILTELNITKVLYFFVTNSVGFVPALSPSEGRDKNQPKLYAEALVNGTTDAFIQNLGFTGIIAGGTGIYTISFNELPNTDYYFEANIVVSARVCMQPNASSKTTTSVTFRITDFAGVAYEPEQFSVKIKVR